MCESIWWWCAKEESNHSSYWIEQKWRRRRMKESRKKNCIFCLSILSKRAPYCNMCNVIAAIHISPYINFFLFSVSLGSTHILFFLSTALFLSHPFSFFHVHCCCFFLHSFPCGFALFTSFVEHKICNFVHRCANVMRYIVTTRNMQRHHKTFNPAQKWLCSANEIVLLIKYWNNYKSIVITFWMDLGRQKKKKVILALCDWHLTFWAIAWKNWVP